MQFKKPTWVSGPIGSPAVSVALIRGEGGGAEAGDGEEQRGGVSDVTT